jgi:tellurite resistance protein
MALFLCNSSDRSGNKPFAPSCWAFSFRGTALAATPLIMIAHGDHGAAQVLAPILFVGANLLIALLAIGTIRILVQGKLPAKPPSGIRAGAT